MTAQPGWYDDPWDPRRYRYWDGNEWTGHSSPKFMADVGTGQQPAHPVQAGGPRTADGVPLSGWWRRVGARILDGIITALLGLPLTFYFYVQFFEAYGDYTRRLRAEGPQANVSFFPPGEVLQWALVVSLISTAVYVLYEAVLLRRSGATLGKRATGIRVRPSAGDGVLPWAVIARRIGVYFGLSTLATIPLVGILFSLLSLLNVLWPLWDDKRQTWHDKVAGTQVVRA